MLTIFNIVLPIFGLIFVGFALGRWRVLSEHASREINRFVIYLALPALMVEILLKTPWKDFYQPGYLAAFELAVVIPFALVLFFRWRQTKSLSRATIDATAASYANNGYIGIPLCTLLFGAENLAPTLLACTLTVSANFAVSIILMEAGKSEEGNNRAGKFKTVFYSLIKNPLVIIPFIAVVFRLSGLSLPESCMRFIKLLSGATIPCALVGIGLFLSAKQKKTEIAMPVCLSVFKLLAQPLLAWFFAAYVFDMPPMWVTSLVILSALPTGTGPFMLAELYQVGGQVSSRTILFSTCAAVVTLPIFMYLLV